jgi:hypothetical protein
MSEPLTLEDIAALPVGARVWWHDDWHFQAERVGPNLWTGLDDIEGEDFTDADMAGDPVVYLVEPEEAENAPADSTGARCAVYAVEAGPVEDCDEGDPLVAAFIRWRDADDPRPLWEYVGTDEAGLDARIRRRMTDIDGTPDTLPAVDACAS